MFVPEYPAALIWFGLGPRLTFDSVHSERKAISGEFSSKRKKKRHFIGSDHLVGDMALGSDRRCMQLAR
jgi:hypothetical protein